MTAQNAPSEKPFTQAVMRWAPIIAPLPLLAIVLWTGLRGLDFGYHWDEWLNLYKISETVKSNVLLPHWYDYPAMIYWISLLVLAPTIPAAMRQPDFSLLAFTESDVYLLQNRAVFIIITALAVLWVYLAVLEWRKRWPEALLAAGLLGLSWEIAYHSRYLAPDAIMMQFGALAALMMVVAYHRPEKRHWLRFAAIAAGMATATKYTAGVFVFPLVLLTLHVYGKTRWWKILLGLVETGALFGFTYLVITPGTIIEPSVFIASLRQVSSMYHGGHEMHTISPGWEHFSALMNYFTFEGFSHFRVIAAVFAGLALAGIVALIRDSWRLALILLSFPLAFLAYFVLKGHVMIVRNVIIVIPFMAVFAARGAGLLFDALKDRRLQWGLVGLMAALLVVNAAWLFTAAETIHDRGTDRFAEAFANYAGRQGDTPIYATDAVWDALEEANITAPDNLTRSFDGAEQAAFYAFPALGCLPANDAFLPLRTFGPYEVNLLYYPNWAGEDHLVVMPVDALEARNLTRCLE